MSLKIPNLEGLGVAMVTPFTKKNMVDYDALEKLTLHLVKGNVDYIVLMGTTGETATLSLVEKKLIVDKVKSVSKKKVKIVVGIGGNDTSDVLKQFERYDLNDVSAILSVSPYYNKPNAQGIIKHYKAINDYSPLPIILYNVPGRTGSNVGINTTIEIAKQCNKVFATKEASGNMDQIMSIINNAPSGFKVISGDDNLTVPLMSVGAIGVISVTANAFPMLCSKMIRAALKKDFSTASKIHYSLFEITNQFFNDGSPGGVKQALKLLDLCEAYVRMPLDIPNKETIIKIKQLTQKLK
jgi:4-hydroxy-tetrahydrodipicolinate synthase